MISTRYDNFQELMYIPKRYVTAEEAEMCFQMVPAMAKE
jgi:hypothetical protein